MKETHLLSVIGRIYEAAADPEQWAGVLGLIRNQVNADAIAVYQSQDHPMFFCAGREPRTLTDYVQIHAQQDPRFRRLMRVGCGRAVTSEMLMPTSALQRTDVYLDYFHPWDLLFVLAGLLDLPLDSPPSLFILARSEKHDDFEEEDRIIMQSLLPHIQRSLQLQSRLFQTRQQHKVALDVLDYLPFGVFILDSPGRLISMNKSGQNIVDLKDGLILTRRGLRLSRKSEQEHFGVLVAGEAHTNGGNGGSAGGTMAVSRPSSCRPFQLSIVPLPSSANVMLAGCSSVVVFATDTEKERQTPEQFLIQDYGLTPAEARLASLLSRGTSLSELADSLSISRETARNQLKSVFSKTDTHRQGELIGLLLRAPGASHNQPQRATPNPPVKGADFNGRRGGTGLLPW